MNPVPVATLAEMFQLSNGALIWLAPPKYHPDLVGSAAGSPIPNHSGKVYWCVQICGRKVRRSHIVFALSHGRWPANQVDHIDGNSLNDDVSNLREATATQNAWNHKRRAKRSPLPMGVRSANSGRFVARIAVNKRQITIGTFLTASEAETAYQQARRQYFGEFA